MDYSLQSREMSLRVTDGKEQLEVKGGSLFELACIKHVVRSNKLQVVTSIRVTGRESHSSFHERRT